MKKLISIFLSLIIILGCFGFTVSADEETPIVIVPGFMGSKLYADSDFDDRVFGENGDVNEFSKIAAKRLFVKEPVNLQKAAEYGAGNKYKALASVLCDTYPKRKVYFFSYDFTKNAQSGAVLLNEFLKTQPKVILVCHSYGGLVVASYVERGAADIGVVGKDILLEYEPDIYELADMNLGKCRMCVAAKKGFRDNPEKTLKVATKFVNIARSHYAGKGRDIEICKLNGSIEIAPILNMTDVIVDIVETGTTLKENDLEVIETIIPISARLIANKASTKFKAEQISQLRRKLQEVIEK